MPTDLTALTSDPRFKKFTPEQKKQILTLGLEHDPDYKKLPPEYQARVLSAAEKKYISNEQPNPAVTAQKPTPATMNVTQDLVHPTTVKKPPVGGQHLINTTGPLTGKQDSGQMLQALKQNQGIPGVQLPMPHHSVQGTPVPQAVGNAQKQHQIQAAQEIAKASIEQAKIAHSQHMGEVGAGPPTKAPTPESIAKYNEAGARMPGPNLSILEHVAPGITKEIANIQGRRGVLVRAAAGVVDNAPWLLTGMGPEAISKFIGTAFTGAMGKAAIEQVGDKEKLKSDPKGYYGDLLVTFGLMGVPHALPHVWANVVEKAKESGIAEAQIERARTQHVRDAAVKGMIDQGHIRINDDYQGVKSTYLPSEGGKPNAVQKPSTAKGVPRKTGPKVELQEVGKGNAKEKPTGTGKGKTEEVKPASRGHMTVETDAGKVTTEFKEPRNVTPTERPVTGSVRGEREADAGGRVPKSPGRSSGETGTGKSIEAPKREAEAPKPEIKRHPNGVPETVQRYSVKSEGVDPSSGHGMNTSPAGIKSIYDYLPDHSEYKTNPEAKVLDVSKSTHFSAGVAAAEHFLGAEEFKKLRETKNQDEVEVVGVTAARKAGYDAVLKNDKHSPTLDEYLALNDKAFLPEVPKPAANTPLTRQQVQDAVKKLNGDVNPEDKSGITATTIRKLYNHLKKSDPSLTFEQVAQQVHDLSKTDRSTVTGGPVGKYAKSDVYYHDPNAQGIYSVEVHPELSETPKLTRQEANTKNRAIADEWRDKKVPGIERDVNTTYITTVAGLDHALKVAPGSRVRFGGGVMPIEELASRAKTEPGILKSGPVWLGYEGVKAPGNPIESAKPEPVAGTPSEKFQAPAGPTERPLQGNVELNAGVTAQNLVRSANAVGDVLGVPRGGRYKASSPFGVHNELHSLANARAQGHAMASESYRDVTQGLNPTEVEQLGKFLVSQRLRALHGPGGHVQALSDTEMEAIWNKPKLQAALLKHAGGPQSDILTLRQKASPKMRLTGGFDYQAPGGEDIFASLVAKKDAAGNVIEQYASGAPSRALHKQLGRRGTRFAQEAKGQAAEYSTDLKEIYDQSFMEAIEPAAKADFYEEAKAKGVAVTPKKGQPAPKTMTFNGNEYRAVEVLVNKVRKPDGSVIDVKAWMPEPVAKDFVDATSRNPSLTNREVTTYRTATGAIATKVEGGNALQSAMISVNLASPTAMLNHGLRELSLLTGMRGLDKSVTRRIIDTLLSVHTGRLVPRLSRLYDIYNTDMRLPENQAIYKELVKNNAYAPRTFSSYVSSRIPGLSKIKEFGHDFLFSEPEGKGLKGFDIRARVIAEKARRSVEGNADPQRMREFSYQLGEYVSKPDKAVQIAKQLNPYAGTSLPMRMAELRQLTGNSGLDISRLSNSQKLALKAETLFTSTAGSVMSLVLYNQLMSGHWPWENKKGHEYDLDLGNGMYLSAMAIDPTLRGAKSIHSMEFAGGREDAGDAAVKAGGNFLLQQGTGPLMSAAAGAAGVGLFLVDQNGHAELIPAYSGATFGSPKSLTALGNPKSNPDTAGKRLRHSIGELNPLIDTGLNLATWENPKDDPGIEPWSPLWVGVQLSNAIAGHPIVKRDRTPQSSGTVTDPEIKREQRELKKENALPK